MAKRLRQALEALAAVTAWGLFRLLPLDMASAVGGRLGRLIGPRLRATRTARRNLARALPELEDAVREQIVLAMWDNLGRVIGEFPHLHRIAAERVELVGSEWVDLLRDDGQAGIFISGHLGNWELSGAVARRHGLPLHLIYRAANNPWVERLYRAGRRDASGALIQKGSEGARQALKVLKGGGHLGLLIDHKQHDGIPIPFFGREAMTAPAVAQFATRFGCPLVPARVERLGGAHFRVTVLPPLEPPPPGPEANRLLLTRVNILLEEWIRATPEQWLWLHRRWPE